MASHVSLHSYVHRKPEADSAIDSQADRHNEKPFNFLPPEYSLICSLGQRMSSAAEIAAYYDGLSSVLDVARLDEPGDRFEVGRLLGEGTYGEVYQAKDTKTGKVKTETLFTLKVKEKQSAIFRMSPLK